MNHIKKTFTFLTTTIVLLLAVNVSLLFAQMGGGMGMTNDGGFGMMNGMAGSPVVGGDGTVYMVSFEPSFNPGTVPNSNSFASKLMAINPNTGQVVSLNLNGVLSRPVVSGNLLVATASLPNFNNFHMIGNLGTNSSSQQSVLYGIQLPLTASAVPIAVSLDGSFASVPVIANNQIYVTTSGHGDFMMGRNMFDGMFGNFNFNDLGNHRSFLYVIGFDGTLINKIEIE